MAWACREEETPSWRMGRRRMTPQISFEIWRSVRVFSVRNELRLEMLPELNANSGKMVDLGQNCRKKLLLFSEKRTTCNEVGVLCVSRSRVCGHVS